MKVDIRSPTPMQSMKTTHSSSLSVSRTPMSSTRPKPIVDTAGQRNEGSVRKRDRLARVGKLKDWWGHKGQIFFYLAEQQRIRGQIYN